MDTGRVLRDSKHTYSGITKDDFSSRGGDDFRVKELTFRAEKNGTLDLYVSNNLSALFFYLNFSLKLKPASVSVPSLGFSMRLVSILTSFKFIFWLASVLAFFT